MDYNSFLQLVKSRRTIRRFKSDPVPDELIGKVIEAGRWAPSGFNMQPWEFVVIKDKKLKDSIVQWIHDYHRLIMKTETARESWQRVPHRPSHDPEMDYKNAPVSILILGATRTHKGLPTAMRYDAERLRTIYTSSLANAYLYMSLAATTLGLANNGIIYGGNPKQLGAQLVGSVCTIAFVVVSMGIVFKLIDMIVGLRVSREEELRGLDIGEHGMEAYGDFQIFCTT